MTGIAAPHAACGRLLWLSPDLTHAFIFGLLLVGYGNAVSALPERLTDRYDWAFILLGFGLMAAVLAWLRRRGLTAGEIGLTRRRFQRDLLTGLAAGAALILPAVLYFLFPVGMPDRSLEYEEAEEATAASFLLWALVQQPLGTSVFEEVMFRGALQGLAVRAFRARRGILFTALAFSLWHLVINNRTVRETNAGEELTGIIAAQAVSLIVLMAGGVVLGVLRHRTGGLTAPIACHWLVVVAMQGTLFATAG